MSFQNARRSISILCYLVELFCTSYLIKQLMLNVFLRLNKEERADLAAWKLFNLI